jgi:Tat protein secretion system quality control protein TatD with DNase activity
LEDKSFDKILNIISNNKCVFGSYGIHPHEAKNHKSIKSGDIIKKTKLNKELEKQESFLNQLRQAILQEAVEGKMTAEWRKQHPELISGENHAARLLKKISSNIPASIQERCMPVGMMAT